MLINLVLILTKKLVLLKFHTQNDYFFETMQPCAGNKARTSMWQEFSGMIGPGYIINERVLLSTKKPQVEEPLPSPQVQIVDDLFCHHHG